MELEGEDIYITLLDLFCLFMAKLVLKLNKVNRVIDDEPLNQLLILCMH